MTVFEAFTLFIISVVVSRGILGFVVDYLEWRDKREERLRR